MNIIACAVLLFFASIANAATVSMSLPSDVQKQGEYVLLPKATAIPADVIAAIKAAPTESARGIAGFYRFTGQVMKAESITISARALLQLEKVDVPFIAIVAKDLYLEVPATRDEVAKITRAPDSLYGNLNGAIGAQGNQGRSDWPTENGSDGGPGGQGGTGGHGRTAVIPDIYIFFQRITISSGNPSTSGLLRFSLNGVPGGNGGVGGPGGPGGAGAPGTPSECNVLECRTGPGKGGNGGQGGSGGKGGNAANGGNGGNLLLLGPKTEWKFAGFFEVIQEPAGPGVPGQGGSAGIPGIAGGGGHRCHACNGRSGGHDGASANPPNLGAGSQALGGARGTKALVERANDDLF